MKLCAIYIAWFDGIEILPFSIAQIRDLVDEVLIIYSNTSNFGQTFHYQEKIEGLGTLINWEPDLRRSPAINETAKRNFGLTAAKAMGFTHFVMMDCDEIYDRNEFEIVKKATHESINGWVCGLRVYVNHPTLVCDDHTLVPFIHKLSPELKYEFGNKTYPFAYDDSGHAHIDPTRRLNIKSGIEWSSIKMHHFSHVRKNIRLKMENSTARNNLNKSTLLEDYENARPGYYSKFYRKTLEEVPNRFGIQF